MVEVEVSRGNHYGNPLPERIYTKVVEWKSRKQYPLYFAFVTNKKWTPSQNFVDSFYTNRALRLVGRTFFFSCKEEACSRR